MILAPLLLALAVAASPFRPLDPQRPTVSGSPSCTKEKLTASKGTGKQKNEGIANLPFAMGRRFSTLVQYLTLLKCRAAPIDLPWYKEIRPGVFELQTCNLRRLPADKGPRQKQLFTRAEL